MFLFTSFVLFFSRFFAINTFLLFLLLLLLSRTEYLQQDEDNIIFIALETEDDRSHDVCPLEKASRAEG